MNLPLIPRRRYLFSTAGATLVAAASLTGLSGLSTGAAARGDGTSSPPLLPVSSTAGVVCNQKTQLGLDGCAELKAVAADKRLNSDIRVIWARLSGYQRADLVRAQKDWVIFRSSDCVSQTDVYRGGSILPMELAYCRAAEDGLRRQGLVMLYKTITQDAQKARPLP